MFSSDHLEIIGPEGDVQFYDLDPNKGVTNIGRHPDNDIIIDSPNISPFHVVLDHRQRPYHVVYLGEGQKIRLNGQPLEAHISTDLLYWSSLEVDEHTMILIEGPSAMMGGRPAPTTTTGPMTAPAVQPPTTSGGSVAGATVPLAAVAVAVPQMTAPPPTPAGGTSPLPPGTGPLLPPPVPGGAVPTSTAPMGILVRPPDQNDDYIIVKLEDRLKVIDVEQSATFSFMLTNGGPLVAGFRIEIQGIERSWVVVSPPHANINESDFININLTITPPRAPSSRAGMHHFAIVITSENYPDHVAQLGATVQINPYYEFSVRELDPKHQTVGHNKNQFGKTALPIINKSNTAANFRIEAVDDSRGCNFEFTVPGESANLARQAELKLEPQELTIPILINPLARPFIAVGKKNYPYTVTATMLDGQQTPRTLLGQISVKPVIGPWVIILTIALILAAIVAICRPVVNSFTISSSRDDPGGLTAQVQTGDPAYLHYNASWSTELKLEASTPDTPDAPEDKVGFVMVTPLGDPVQKDRPQVVYTLKGSNFISQLLPFLAVPDRQVTLDIGPAKPGFKFWVDGSTNTATDRNITISILEGESINLKWEILHATTASLITNGTAETLKPEEMNGGRLLTPLAETTYQLEGRNQYYPEGIKSMVITVRVLKPTATPLPVPVIRRFTITPLTVTDGQTVTLEWEVENANQIKISGPGADALTDLPADKGSTLFIPPMPGGIYLLTGMYVVEGVEPSSKQSRPVSVTVNPKPTPTPVPVPPKILSFSASPQEIVKGKLTEITLTWSITGAFTKIDITNASGVSIVPGAGANGFVRVTVSDSAVFNLLAVNVDQMANGAVTIKANDPTPTPVPPPPPAQIAFFNVSGVEDPNDALLVGRTDNSVTYKVRWRAPLLFAWGTSNAAKAMFGLSNGVQAAVPLTGTAPGVITQTEQYLFKALNVAEVSTDYFVTLQLQDSSRPSVPFDVNGMIDAPTGNVTVTWKYNDDPKVMATVLGFRVYRSSDGGFSFTRVGEIRSATVGSPPLAPYFWVDVNPTPGAGPICGMIYQVKTLYVNVSNNQELETDYSGTRYQTLPCPTPTPEP